MAFIPPPLMSPMPTMLFLPSLFSAGLAVGAMSIAPWSMPFIWLWSMPGIADKSCAGWACAGAAPNSAAAASDYALEAP